AAVADDLMDVDHDAPLRLGGEAPWLDARVDHCPLARPVRAYRLAAVDVAAFHSIRPLDVEMHGGQRAVDVARVEGVVRGGQEIHGSRDQMLQPSHSQTPRPITDSRSSPFSHDCCSFVKRSMHSRYEHGMRVRSVPQNVRWGPKASTSRLIASCRSRNG